VRERKNISGEISIPCLADARSVAGGCTKKPFFQEYICRDPVFEIFPGLPENLMDK
jgi:hypothetical protein